jgi:hypothetical protein
MPTTLWTPRTLATRTFAALRERPALAIPVLLADTLAFAALHGERLLQGPILQSLFSSKESVLSSHSSFNLADHSALAPFLVAPFIWASYYLAGLFYSAALLATSLIMRHHEPVAPNLVIDQVTAKRVPLIRFSLRFFGLILLAWLASFLVLALVMQPWVVAHTHGINLAYGAGLFLEIAVGCLALGPALRLLDSTAQFSNLAIYAAVTTLLAQAAIDLALRHLPLNTVFHPPSLFALNLIQLTISLIAAVPYVFLFIALSLLANPTESSDQYPESTGQ